MVTVQICGFAGEASGEPETARDGARERGERDGGPRRSAQGSIRAGGKGPGTTTGRCLCALCVVGLLSMCGPQCEVWDGRAGHSDERRRGLNP